MFWQLPDQLKFTEKDQEILKNLTITRDFPGTILEDFDTLMTILREHKPILTPTHQLPINLLEEINNRLKHPVQQLLKRPQQKGYPPIHGLYLLVRASGLVYVDATGKKPILMVDESLYQQWRNLKPTEQYFFLLETWFLRGHPAIIGENRGHGLAVPDNVTDIINFFSLPQDKYIEDFIKYGLGWFNLALLDLFGFVRIIRDAAHTVDMKSKITEVALTPLGHALLTLLYPQFTRVDLLKSAREVQKSLKSYFPEYKNTVKPPKAKFREGTHIFKISLGSIWRRIAIDSKASLDDLALAILDSVEFDNDHLYEFSYRNRFGSTEVIKHPYLEEEPATSQVLIGDLTLVVGQAMIFLFDFGDNWEFNVLFEKIDPTLNVDGSIVLEKHGEAPQQYDYGDDEEM